MFPSGIAGGQGYAIHTKFPIVPSGSCNKLCVFIRFNPIFFRDQNDQTERKEENEKTEEKERLSMVVY